MFNVTILFIGWLIFNYPFYCHYNNLHCGIELFSVFVIFSCLECALAYVKLKALSIKVLDICIMMNNLICLLRNWDLFVL